MPGCTVEVRHDAGIRAVDVDGGVLDRIVRSDLERDAAV
jgi:hypothetical protein